MDHISVKELEAIRDVVIGVVERGEDPGNPQAVDRLALAIALSDHLVTAKGRRELTLADYDPEEREGYRKMAKAVIRLTGYAS